MQHSQAKKRGFLSFTTSVELNKVLLYTKLTHKCIIVVLCSRALIMHFKTLSYQGPIKGICCRSPIKSTVHFLIKQKPNRKKLQFQRESMCVMHSTVTSF